MKEVMKGIIIIMMMIDLFHKNIFIITTRQFFL
jgi:hypothetical protein